MKFLNIHNIIISNCSNKKNVVGVDRPVHAESALYTKATEKYKWELL